VVAAAICPTVYCWVNSVSIFIIFTCLSCKHSSVYRRKARNMLARLPKGQNKHKVLFIQSQIDSKEFKISLSSKSIFTFKFPLEIRLVLNLLCALKRKVSLSALFALVLVSLGRFSSPVTLSNPLHLLNLRLTYARIRTLS
jgi:hypothetical protein